LVEPFAGSAAVSLAAAAHGKAATFLLNDINEPLVALWWEILEHPQLLVQQYQALWEAQLEDPRRFYDTVRERFNLTGRPHFLLYLLARCVKASVRYNSHGEFNQSPDNRRLGAKPELMAEHIRLASKLLAGKTILKAVDYREILDDVQLSDIVYMDPPYQGTSGNRDPRYAQPVAFGEFVEFLGELARRSKRLIISYDGRTGGKSHGQLLPPGLGLVRYEIAAGKSTQATLLGQSALTYESLYVSERLHDEHEPACSRQLRKAQLELALSRAKEVVA
jgi:DNA adenine methylase